MVIWYFVDLFKRVLDDGVRRDYLYYMLVGYIRIKVSLFYEKLFMGLKILWYEI